jgi:hypothetical protein
LMERENPKLEENMKEFLTIYVRYTTLWTKEINLPTF